MKSGAAAPSVIIASRIYVPEAAAASFRLAGLASALADQGAAVTVLTTTPPLGALGDRDSDTRVAVARSRVLRDATGYVRGYAQYLSFDVPLLFRLLTRRRPAVVVAEPPPTTGLVVMIACALRRIPYVYYAADVWSDAAGSTGAPRPVVAALRAVERCVLSRAQRVIAVSDGVAERVRALGGRDARVVRNGIDTEVFTPGAADTSDDPVPTLVYAGTASEWQGASVFAAAFATVRASVPEARLVFLGQGSELEEIRRIAAEMPPGAITLRGSVPAAQAAKALASATAGLVSLRPGLGYDFAFPTKVFASVAAGTPVVFVGSGPAADTVEREGLGRVAPYDVAAAAEAMIAALREPPSPSRRAELARWAEANASAAAASEMAALCVLGAISRNRTSGTTVRSAGAASRAKSTAANR